MSFKRPTSSRSGNPRFADKSERFEAPAPRHTDAFRRLIMGLLSAPDYQPVKPAAVVRGVAATADEQALAQRALDSLFADGTLVDLKHKGVALARNADLVTGDIRFLRNGAAIVTAADGKRTVFVPNGETSNSLPGDRVVVRLHVGDDRRGRRDDDLSGTVIRVEERRMLTVVGTLKRQSRMYYVKPMSASLTHDIIVPEPGDAQLGDRVLVRLEEWTDSHVSPEGEVIGVIGPADDPAFDTLAVIQSHNLPVEFPEDVIAEAERMRITDKDLVNRKDYRKKYVFTIDPATARDFDDAISLEKQPGGKWKLGVHIADVSHFVKTRGPLDTEARKRGNSVYFPDKVIPMLPEQLANGLCSLQPKTDRLTFSAFLILDDDGNLLSSSFAETVIHSHLRLSYEQAMEAILLPEGAAAPDYGMDKKAVALVKQVHALTMKIRANRFRHGALNMDLPEVRFVIGDDGRILDVAPVVNDESHQLIEECMLLANEAVCAHLCERHIPHLHRIHEEPDTESLQTLEAMFLQAGVDVGDLSDRHEMSGLLQRIMDYPQATAWYTSVLRSFKRARYGVEALGHYGLAKVHYTHFTSPIRRYADLVIHRILKHALSKAAAGKSATTVAREARAAKASLKAEYARLTVLAEEAADDALAAAAAAKGRVKGKAEKVAAAAEAEALAVAAAAARDKFAVKMAKADKPAKGSAAAKAVKAQGSKVAPGYGVDELIDIGVHTSKCEDIAMECERELVDMKRVRFFNEQIASGNLRTYDAVVTEIRNFGLFVFLPAVQTTGMVHVSMLSDDFYDFNAQRLELVGRRFGITYTVGAPLKVCISRVDADRRMLDFSIVAPEESERKPRPPREKRPAGGAYGKSDVATGPDLRTARPAAGPSSFEKPAKKGKKPFYKDITKKNAGAAGKSRRKKK